MDRYTIANSSRSICAAGSIASQEKKHRSLWALVEHAWSLPWIPGCWVVYHCRMVENPQRNSLLTQVQLLQKVLVVQRTSWLWYWLFYLLLELWLRVHAVLSLCPSHLSFFSNICFCVPFFEFKKSLGFVGVTLCQRNPAPSLEMTDLETGGCLLLLLEFILVQFPLCV